MANIQKRFSSSYRMAYHKACAQRKTRRQASAKYMLIALVAFLVIGPSSTNATPIVVSDKLRSFNFVNPDETRNATDFRVVLTSVPPPAIGGGHGGGPFPNTNLQLPATEGGFLRVIYDGGAGVPPGGEYTHSFPDWPNGTTFEVKFSYPSRGEDLQDPIILDQGTFPTEGSTFPVDDIPTVSEWGLIVLTLLGLTVGMIVLGRRRVNRMAGAT